MKNSCWTLTLVACLALAGCGGDSSPGVAGTYELDQEAMTAALLEMGLQAVPEASRSDAALLAEAKADAKRSAEAMQMSFDVDADGTWLGTADMAGQRTIAKGTWTMEGNKITFVTSEKDGKPETNAEPQSATLEDGVMIVEPEGAPFAFRLVRK